MSEETIRHVFDKYSELLEQENIFSKEEYSRMETLSFQERCRKNISIISAISVITALRYGIYNSLEVPYMIAMAGGVTMLRARMAHA